MNRVLKDKEDEAGDEGSRLGVGLHGNPEGLESRMWLGLCRHVQGHT